MSNSVKKIDFSFIDYLTFINAVVQKTIENGEEYKRLYTTLFAANMFYGYEPQTDEDGNYDLNVVWEDLKCFKGIKSENDEIIFEGIDLYKALGDPYRFNDDVDRTLILPFEDYIYDEMMDEIDRKLVEYKNRDTVKESVVKLINGISDYVDDMDNKLGDLNVNETLAQLGTYANAISGVTNGEIGEHLARIIHKENEERNITMRENHAVKNKE